MATYLDAPRIVPDARNYQDFRKLDTMLRKTAATILTNTTGRPMELQPVFEMMIDAMIARLERHGRPYLNSGATKVYTSDGELCEAFSVTVIRAVLRTWKSFFDAAWSQTDGESTENKEFHALKTKIALGAARGELDAVLQGMVDALLARLAAYGRPWFLLPSFAGPSPKAFVADARLADLFMADVVAPIREMWRGYCHQTFGEGRS
jgi:hypothetical protein